MISAGVVAKPGIARKIGAKSIASAKSAAAVTAVSPVLPPTAMPFTYSISDSIMFGVISYTVINALAGNFRRINWIMYVLTAIFIAKYALM